MRYGYFEDGFLRVVNLEPEARNYKQPDGTIRKIIVSIEEQLTERTEPLKPIDDLDEDRLGTAPEGYVVIPTPYDAGDRISFRYATIVDKRYYNSQIQALKQQLEDGDYKVTKCYEASLVGEPAPYDIQQLHTKRQTLRAQINELERQRDSES